MTVADRIRELLEQGNTKTKAGELLGLSRHQVYRALRSPLEGSVSPPNVTKWGTGAARLVPIPRGRESEVVVFGSDFHFPYQDDAAIDSFVKMVMDLQPDRVVLNGDIADFFQLSRFNLSGDRIDSLQEEIDQANKFRGAIRMVAPDARIDETEGNHDNRVSTYVLKNAKALKTLRALQPENLFQYDEYEINWHPGAGFLLRKHFLVKHGSFVRAEAGASAKAEFMSAGISGISGHTHRLARYRKVGYTQREWLEQGCLCRLDPDYVAGGLPNWTQGCAIGEFSTKAPYRFIIHEVPFLDGKLRFGKEAF